MMSFTNNAKYNASLILDIILNEDYNNIIDDSIFCNAIRLCLGKNPIKHSNEYYRNSSAFDFLKEKNAANDVY